MYTTVFSEGWLCCKKNVIPRSVGGKEYPITNTLDAA